MHCCDTRAATHAPSPLTLVEVPVMPEHTGAVMEPARDAKLPRETKKKPTGQ